MANRTTVAEVKAIIETSLETEDIASYISDANTVVTDVLSDTDLSAALLAKIEKWFTAHLISMSRERMARKEEVDGVRVEYMARYGLYLDATTYGQTVKTMDSSGRMSGLGGKEAGLWSISTT